MTERGWGREGEGYNIYTDRKRDTHTYMHTERECGEGREFRNSIVMQTSSINIWQRGLLKQGREWYIRKMIVTVLLIAVLTEVLGLQSMSLSAKNSKIEVKY